MPGRRKGLNDCRFIGFLGSDPELRYTPNGRAVATFNIGVTRRWKDNANGEWQEKTDWVPIVAWESLAEWCAQNLTKGNCVFVDTRMQVRSWDDKGDPTKKVYKTEFIARDINLLERRDDAGGGGFSPDLPDDDDPADEDLPF